MSNITSDQKSRLSKKQLTESEEQEIMKEVKRRERLKQKQLYEQKLKELERLERTLKAKEQGKKRK